MRILVTGSAGFLGYHLCHRLLTAGHEVVGIDSLTTGNSANVDDLRSGRGYTFVPQDICTPLSIPGQVDRVFNMACPASPVDFHDKAVEIMLTCSVGVKNLLDL